MLRAEVVREYIDAAFDARVPVRVLRWHDLGERLWELPQELCVTGAAPTRLGVWLRREGEGDGYAVRLLWDRTILSWVGLSKYEILGSCLGPLLAALGLDLWSMLEKSAPRQKSLAA